MKKKFFAYSVLMSVYHKEKPEWLREALNSIYQQSIPPEEIVLVEDGPLTDELYFVIDTFKKECDALKIVPLKQNQGLGLALREGVGHCSNELIARMDSDDIAAPDRCEKLLKEFNNDDKLDVVGSWEKEFWEDDVSKIFSCHKVPETHDEILKFMRYRCALLHPTVMFKKTAVLRAGNYQHRELLEDYDLFVRMLKSGSKAYNIQEGLYYLRVNPMLFKRRGGWRYAKTLLQFKYHLWKEGFFSFQSFLISGLGHFCVCLLPNKIRVAFYKYFLR